MTNENLKIGSFINESPLGLQKEDKKAPVNLTFSNIKIILTLQFKTFFKERYFSWRSKSFLRIQSRIQLHYLLPNHLESWYLSLYIRRNNNKITVFSNLKSIKKW